MKIRIYWIIIISVVAITFGSIYLQNRKCEPGLEFNTEGLYTYKPENKSAFVKEYLTAADFFESGKLTEAERIYRKINRKEPDFPDSYLGLAACRMGNKDFTSAQKLYQKALIIEPKSVNALVGLGSVYCQKSNYAKAVEKYKTAITLDETSPEALWGLVIVYVYLDKKAQARSHLNRLKQIRPDSRHIASLEAFIDQ